jgi:hypothetical protein
MTEKEKNNLGSASVGEHTTSETEQTGLAQRLFTKKQADLAAKIANDIAEGMDFKESKSDLRMAVHYWSCVASDANNLRISRDSQAVINAIESLRGHVKGGDAQLNQSVYTTSDGASRFKPKDAPVSEHQSSIPKEKETSRADEFVDWHMKNAPQPWTPAHAKSYLRSLVERDIYNKLCSIEKRVQGSEVHAPANTSGDIETTKTKLGVRDREKTEQQ